MQVLFDTTTVSADDMGIKRVEFRGWRAGAPGLLKGISGHFFERENSILAEITLKPRNMGDIILIYRRLIKPLIFLLKQRSASRCGRFRAEFRRSQ